MLNQSGKLILTSILLLMLIITSNIAKSGSSQELQKMKNNKGVLNNNDTIEPRPIMISWIGKGRLGTFTISNTGQNGYFEPPIGWPGYTGEFPWGYTSGNGRTGEYPKATGQYYIFSSGVWIGGLLPDNEPRVAACGYYSDQGALYNLYQSNQRIPEGAEGAGDFLFKQQVQKAVYQYIWSYQDSSINEKRTYLGLDEYLIDMENGEFVSDEDTYSIFGDYFPEEDACTMFSTGYDTAGLGICVEQRTYSWSTTDFIFLDYKIKNMNSFPLKDVYVGYFSDTDIGSASDDMTMYDKAYNVGYAYDSDGYEAGWSYPPGFLGSMICDARKKGEQSSKGLTGFQTWWSGSGAGDIDDQGTDDLKYEHLKKTTFTYNSEPRDIRYLVSSGPFENLAPNEEIYFTVVKVAGDDSVDFMSNVKYALELYTNAYVMEITSIEESPLVNLDKYNLLHNYPNPFNNSTVIRFYVPQVQDVQIEIFDQLGKKVSAVQLKDVYGENFVNFDASNLSSGIYYYALKAKNYYKVNKMLLIK